MEDAASTAAFGDELDDDVGLATTSHCRATSFEDTRPLVPLLPSTGSV